MNAMAVSGGEMEASTARKWLRAVWGTREREGESRERERELHKMTKKKGAFTFKRSISLLLMDFLSIII